MIGPEQRGHWTQHLRGANSGDRYEHLVAGARYTVVKPFTDFDGDVHSPGEAWTFLGYSFVPYEDGLSLFVSINATDEWHIRLHLDDQSDVVAQIASFVKLASA